jgi:NAD(P)H dehydrogenase (quinone)
MTIVVTGVTGVVGGYVARELAALRVPFRMLVRDPERAPDLPGADVAVASYDDPGSLAAALEPGDRVFMVSMHQAYDSRVELHRAFIDEAIRQRVGHLVYLSFIAAGADASFSHARSHGATETMLRDSGLSWSAVRNGMYGDEIASWFDPDGRITGSGGQGRISFSYRPELGKAIAVLLADQAFDDRRLVTITTPDAVSLGQLAALATDLTGNDYRYEPLDREEWIAYRRSVGRPEWSIEAGITYYDGVARGEADVVSGEFEELTGTPARTVRELLELYRNDLPLSGAAAR